jgi:hypothetical protein
MTSPRDGVLMEEVLKMMLACVDEDQGLWRPRAMLLQPNFTFVEANITLGGMMSPLLGLFCKELILFLILMRKLTCRLKTVKRHNCWVIKPGFSI